jgi:hypothetical protein
VPRTRLGSSKVAYPSSFPGTSTRMVIVAAAVTAFPLPPRHENLIGVDANDEQCTTIEPLQQVLNGVAEWIRFTDVKAGAALAVTVFC